MTDKKISDFELELIKQCIVNGTNGMSENALNHAEGGFEQTIVSLVLMQNTAVKIVPDHPLWKKVVTFKNVLVNVVLNFLGMTYLSLHIIIPK